MHTQDRSDLAVQHVITVHYHKPRSRLLKKTKVKGITLAFDSDGMAREWMEDIDDTCRDAKQGARRPSDAASLEFMQDGTSASPEGLGTRQLQLEHEVRSPPTPCRNTQAPCKGDAEWGKQTLCQYWSPYHRGAFFSLYAEAVCAAYAATIIPQCIP
jgi:hypothetical protein